MALQFSTGVNSLVGLGLGIGDVAVLVSLGKKLGSWLTANADGEQLLDLLDLDELTIFERRGLVDIFRFNKIWGSTITLRINDRVEEVQGDLAEKTVDKLSSFTAIMVCLSAALEAFAHQAVVKDTLKRVLSGLLSVVESSEEVLHSQLGKLHNGWRSTADVRKLTAAARSIRRRLLHSGAVMEGFMPLDDSPTMAKFLLWLLKGDGDTYTTSSSDVAGVAFCLSELGIDILSVGGLVDDRSPTPCRLIYTKNALVERHDHNISTTQTLFRVASTTVNLEKPQESLTKFPTKMDVGNQCRLAWKEGAKAAKQIACSLIPMDPKTSTDMAYAFVNQGSEPERTPNDSIYAMASAHSFGVNQELLDGLQCIFQHQPTEVLEWICHQTLDHGNTIANISDPRFEDGNKIGAYTIFQAFFMGYYYAVFLRLVDISMLQVPTVEGCWGFRSCELLKNMRLTFLGSNKVIGYGTRALSRREVIYILSVLFCSAIDTLPGESVPCVGFIGRRTLLAKSLINPCNTLHDIGCFVLLDCDTSGIPRDKSGLVRPGVSIQDSFAYRIIQNQVDTAFTGSVSEDVTFHIQPDWDRDEETLLLCVRYKGRRIALIDPYKADANFCYSLVRPVAGPKAPTAEIIGWTATDIINQRPVPEGQRLPIVVHVPNQPRLRYLVIAIYSSSAIVKLATNCDATAIEEATKEAERRKLKVDGIIVVRGDGLESKAKPEDWCYLPLPTAGHDRRQVEALPMLLENRGQFGTEGWKRQQDY